MAHFPLKLKKVLGNTIISADALKINCSRHRTIKVNLVNNTIFIKITIFRSYSKSFLYHLRVRWIFFMRTIKFIYVENGFSSTIYFHGTVHFFIASKGELSSLPVISMDHLESKFWTNNFRVILWQGLGQNWVIYCYLTTSASMQV